MTTVTTTHATATTADRILDIFRDVDPTTVAEIVTATGLSKTTVNTHLRKLADEGHVIRMDRDGASWWSLTPSRKAANKKAAAKLAKQAAAAKSTAAKAPRKVAVKVTAEQAERAADNADVIEARRRNESGLPASSGRRTKGQIDGEIVAFLAAHRSETFGSYAVAKAIGSSAGAAYVALKRMDRDGVVRLASTEPDRYTLA
jgi:DNA-binding transcriptional ArsR family regulator